MFICVYTPFDNIRDILVAMGCTESTIADQDYFQIEIPIDDSGAQVGTVHEEAKGQMLYFVINAQSLTGFRHFIELLVNIPEP